jgi:hypothetical protein
MESTEHTSLIDISVEVEDFTTGDGDVKTGLSKISCVYSLTAMAETYSISSKRSISVNTRARTRKNNIFRAGFSRDGAHSVGMRDENRMRAHIARTQSYVIGEQ